MKIIGISDLHGILPLIPECDVVCICGDTSPIEYDRYVYKVQEWFKTHFFNWVRILPCKKVIFIGGNHDFFLARTWESKPAYVIEDLKPIKDLIAESEVSDKLVYLENESYQFEGINFYGCPAVQHLPGWGYYTATGEEYDRIPDNCDVLLTHMAPAIKEVGRDLCLIRDFGSKELAKVIRNKPNLRYALCGHIHDGDHTPTPTEEGTMCINCSMLDNNYELAYKPVEIEIQTILLPNRYGDKNYLLFKGMEDDKYVYELRLQSDLGTRLILGDGPEEIVAIDPSGGPMIGIGYEIKKGDLTLELIEIDNLTLKFKEYVN
jgi:Icc-related predicted phosphoesterase